MPPSLSPSLLSRSEESGLPPGSQLRDDPSPREEKDEEGARLPRPRAELEREVKAVTLTRGVWSTSTTLDHESKALRDTGGLVDTGGACGIVVGVRTFKRFLRELWRRSPGGELRAKEITAQRHSYRFGVGVTGTLSTWEVPMKTVFDEDYRPRLVDVVPGNMPFILGLEFIEEENLMLHPRKRLIIQTTKTGRREVTAGPDRKVMALELLPPQGREGPVGMSSIKKRNPLVAEKSRNEVADEHHDCGKESQRVIMEAETAESEDTEASDEDADVQETTSLEEALETLQIDSRRDVLVDVHGDGRKDEPDRNFTPEARPKRRSSGDGVAPESGKRDIPLVLTLGMKEVMKLHKHGHVPPKRLFAFLKRTLGRSERAAYRRKLGALHDMCKEAQRQCQGCRKAVRARHPGTAIRDEYEFNHNLVIDLICADHQNNIWALVVVDEGSDETVVARVESKGAKDVALTFVTKWIMRWGSPKSVVWSDLGGEFRGPEFLEACEEFGCVKFGTPPYVPEAHGKVEARNRAVRWVLNRVAGDTTRRPQTRREWDLRFCVIENDLRNTLMRGEFTPSERSCGRGTHALRTLWNDTPTSAAERTTETVQRLREIQELARDAIHQVGADRKLRRLLVEALPVGTREYQKGELVHYWREKGWRGPAVVVGYNAVSRYHWLDHGGTLLRAGRLHVKGISEYNVGEKRQVFAEPDERGDPLYEEQAPERAEAKEEATEQEERIVAERQPHEVPVHPMTPKRTAAEPDRAEPGAPRRDAGEREGDPGETEELYSGDWTKPPDIDEVPDAEPARRSERTMAVPGRLDRSPWPPPSSSAAVRGPLHHPEHEWDEPTNADVDGPRFRELKSEAEVERLKPGSKVVVTWAPSTAEEQKYEGTITADRQGLKRVLYRDGYVDYLFDSQEGLAEAEGDRRRLFVDGRVGETTSVDVYLGAQIEDRPCEPFTHQAWKVVKELMKVQLTELDHYGNTWEDVAPELQVESRKRGIDDYENFDCYRGGAVRKSTLSSEVRAKRALIFDGRWVDKAKIRNDQVEGRSRWTPKGFQERESGDQQYDSPTASLVAHRTLAVDRMRHRWGGCKVDLTSAFFQQDRISRLRCGRPVKGPRKYLTLPPELQTVPGEILVRELDKEVPGTKGAPLGWFRTLRRVLAKEFEMKASKVDPCVFYSFKGSEYIGYVATHVDDVHGGGTEDWLMAFEACLRKHVKIGTFDRTGLDHERDYDFVGLHWAEREEGLYLDQNMYIERVLVEVELEPERKKQKDDEATSEELEDFRSVLGKALWLTKTRPETCRDLSEAASMVTRLTVKDINKLNKVVRRIKNSPERKLFLKRPPLLTSLSVTCIADAALSSHEGERTQGGRCVGLTWGSGCDFAPVEWKSGKIRRVASSSFDAETLENLETIDAGLTIGMILEETRRGPRPSMVLRKWLAQEESGWKHIPTQVHLLTDSNGFVTKVRNVKDDIQISRRRKVDIADVKELVAMDYLCPPMHVPGDLNPLDILTKDVSEATERYQAFLDMVYAGDLHLRGGAGNCTCCTRTSTKDVRIARRGQGKWARQQQPHRGH